jgi:D-mannonate dehydratase
MSAAAPPSAGSRSKRRATWTSVREKGLVAFARDAKKTAWEEKLKQWREEAMKAMGLTQDRLDAMPPEQRSAALKMVEEAVQQKIKDAMESARKQGKDGVSVPQFVDMSV